MTIVKMSMDIWDHELIVWFRAYVFEIKYRIRVCDHYVLICHFTDITLCMTKLCRAATHKTATILS